MNMREKLCMILHHAATVILALLIFIGGVNIISNFFYHGGDCYYPPSMLCEYQHCRAAGLNYSRIVEINETNQYMCICLNGTEEVVR